MRSSQAGIGLVLAVTIVVYQGVALGQPTAPPSNETTPAPTVTPVTDLHPSPRVFLGASLGLGELHLRLGETNTWGRSTAIEAWAGVALARNLVLFFQFYDAHVFNPSSTYAELTALNLVGTGPGLKYYLTPHQLYLSASLLLTRANLSNPERDLWGGEDGIDENTRWGATGRLALGKEWQTSPHWRLGLQGDVLLGRMGHAPSWPVSDETSALKGFSLLFSATYHPASALAATSAVRSPLPHTRRGLYLDAHLGIGSFEGRFGSYPVSGIVWPIAVAAGWSATQRLVLVAGFSHGRLFSVDAGYYGLHDAALDTVGPGLKYYLTSSNLFLAASAELARLDFRHEESAGNGSFHTRHRGVVLRLSYGKEWWLSNRWGIGLAGEVMLGRMSYGDEDSYGPGGSYRPEQFSLYASATYNHAAGDEADTSPTDETGAPLSLAQHHTHDGFYAGVRLGVGWLKLRGSSDTTLSGWGQPFALSAGFAVTRNLILFGEFFGAQIRNPTVDWGYGLVDFDLMGIGPGVRYYLMPSNVFASCSLLVSELGYRDEEPSDFRYGTNVGSQWGFTGRLSLGKEVWVSSNWGLGVAGELLLGRMTESGDRSFTVKALSVLASASFN
jgi:hypothetical protein